MRNVLKYLLCINVSEISTAKVQTKCSPKIDRNNARIWLQPNDAITIVVSQSSPSSDEEHVHYS